MKKKITKCLPFLFIVLFMYNMLGGFNAAATNSLKNAETNSVSQQVKITVRGSVEDKDGPITGAVVFEKGTKNATTTDSEGKFSLTVEPKSTLSVSYLGYEPQEIAVNNQTSLPAIRLQEKEETLSEIVVTGYQSLSRERVTGSFGTISQTKLENQLQSDFKSMFEGQIPGLAIDRNGKIEIRGVSTFNAFKAPLLVIDGYPVDATMNDVYFNYRDGTFENINANNIASITVLKDAVATSIYGSRAANGVIVLTTKRGIEGDPKIAYKGTFSVIAEPDLRNLHKASASDYIDAEIDLFRQSPTSNLNGSLTQVAYLLARAEAGLISPAEAQKQIDALRNNDYIGEAQKYLFRPKLTQQHNVSISGGTKTHNYNIAFNYINTRENYVYSGNNRAVIDVRDEWKVNKYITLGANLNVAYSATHSPIINTNEFQRSNTVSLFTFATGGSTYTPYTSLVDSKGNPAAIWVPGNEYRKQVYATIPGAKNPDWIFLDDLNKEKYWTNDFQSRFTGFMKVNLFEGLAAEIGGNWQRGNYSWKQMRDYDSYTTRTSYTVSTSRANPANHYVPEGAVMDEKRNINESWTVRSQITFNRDLSNDKHRINLLLGNEIRRMTYDNNTLATRLGYNPVAGTFVPVHLQAIKDGQYSSDWYSFPSVTLETGSYSLIDNRFVSWYGNGSYEFDNRFIFSGSIRLDLTNFFGTSTKYRYRPLWSIGGTYKLSEEKFFDVAWANRLYLRASYGIGGNIALNQGPFLILNAGSYNATTGGISYSVASPPNDELRWEKTQTSNFGIDLSVLDSRIQFTLDYYNRLSTDLLAADQVDPTTGVTNVTKNVGAISNNGIEIAINADVIRNRKFNWTVIPNFAYNHNKVITYNATRNYATSYTGGAIHVSGYPADGFWGGRFAGLDDKGAVQAYKADGTIVPIGNLGPEDLVYEGTIRPKFDLSLTNRFNYKNFDLSVMLIAKLGHKYRKDNFSGSNIQNRHVGERWRKAGDEANTIYPVLTSWNMDMFYYPYTDVNIGNASFAKLRDVTLSYTLDKGLTGKVGIGGAKIYLQGRNLFTITAKGTDIDPESFEYNITGGTGAATDQAFSSLPLPREFHIGLQITL